MNVETDNGAITSVSLDYNYVCSREYQDIIKLYNEDAREANQIDSAS